MPTGELWELIGPHWRLPIYAHASPNGVIEVEIAGIPILKAQRKAAEEALRIHCTHRESNTWFFARAGLEQSAVKSHWEDPEDVVIWNWKQREYDVRLAMAKFYCEQSYAVCKKDIHFAAMWASIENFMFDWMVQMGRPIEFSWGRLEALPIRANWKQAMLSTMKAKKQNLAVIGNKDAATRQEAERRVQFNLYERSFMTSLDVETKTIRWTVEFVPNREWHQKIYEFELQRKQRKHRFYFSDVLQLLKSRHLKDRLHAILLAYRKETEIPYAFLNNGNFKRDGGKKSFPIGMAIPPSPGSPTPVVIGRSMDKKGKGFVMVPENALVLSVQDFQQICDDMRHAFENLDSARKIAASESRMPMLDAGQG